MCMAVSPPTVSQFSAGPLNARGSRDSIHHARLFSAGKLPCSHAQCLHPPHHVAAMRSKRPSSCACNHAATGRGCPLLCPTRPLSPTKCFQIASERASEAMPELFHAANSTNLCVDCGSLAYYYAGLQISDRVLCLPSVLSVGC